MLNHKNSWGKINTAVIGGILSTLPFKPHSAHTAIAKKRKEKDTVWTLFSWSELMVPQHFVTRQVMHTKQTRQLHTLDNRALLRACCYQCCVIIYTSAHSYVRLCNTPGISIKSTNTYLCSITINIWSHNLAFQIRKSNQRLSIYSLWTNWKLSYCC